MSWSAAGRSRSSTSQTRLEGSYGEDHATGISDSSCLCHACDAWTGMGFGTVRLWSCRTWGIWSGAMAIHRQLCRSADRDSEAVSMGRSLHRQLRYWTVCGRGALLVQGPVCLPQAALFPPVLLGNHRGQDDGRLYRYNAT